MSRTISHDFVVAIQGDGWSFPKARLLIDSDNNAAVFTSKSGPPDKEFRIQGDTRLTGMRVAVNTDQGPVKYRRRGSSCGWALAQCQMKTAPLVARWPERPFDKGGPVESGVITKTSVEDSRVYSQDDLDIQIEPHSLGDAYNDAGESGDES